MLKKFGYSFLVLGILFFGIIVNNTLFSTVVAAPYNKPHGEHKAEDHGMTGNGGEGSTREVEHEHKEAEEPKTKHKPHGEHKAEDHGMTGD